jgi:hypothetical protein
VCVCVCVCVRAHTHTHTHTLSLSLSLSHTHTHACRNTSTARARLVILDKGKRGLQRKSINSTIQKNFVVNIIHSSLFVNCTAQAYLTKMRQSILSVFSIFIDRFFNILYRRSASNIFRFLEFFLKNRRNGRA